MDDGVTSSYPGRSGNWSDSPDVVVVAVVVAGCCCCGLASSRSWTPGALIASGPSTGGRHRSACFGAIAWAGCDYDYVPPLGCRERHGVDGSHRDLDGPYVRAACRPSCRRPLCSAGSCVSLFGVDCKTRPGPPPFPAAVYPPATLSLAPRVLVVCESAVLGRS